MQEQLWVEPVGDIIIARLRGVPTEAMMKECQARVLQLLKDTAQGDTARGKVLYDGLEMESPSVDIALVQQKLEAELGTVQFRRAIVVPSSRIAYLARIAFGEGDYRVFYSDMAAAIKWLQE
jgi:hypothetical protein